MFRGRIYTDLAEGFAVPGFVNILSAPDFFELYQMTEETAKLLKEISLTSSIYGFYIRNYEKDVAASEQTAKDYIIKIFKELREDDPRLPGWLKSEIIAYVLKYTNKEILEKKESKNEN